MRTALAVAALGVATAAMGACTDDSAVNNTNNKSGSSDVSSKVSTLVNSVCQGAPFIEEAGSINVPELTNPTGLTASKKYSGLWWVNDKGANGARVWVVNDSGGLVATVKLDKVEPVDWEEIASVANDNGNETLYVADTGDLAAERKAVALYSFSAPDLSKANAGDPLDATVEATRHEFTYPDGAHDSKAMFVDPSAGEFYLITNDPAREDAPGIYRGELSDGTERPAMLAKLEPFKTAPVPIITAADLSPDGSAIGIRAYGRSGIWSREGRQAIDEVFQQEGCEAPSIPEVQGEGLGFAADGSYYMTISAAGTLTKVQPPG